MKKEGGECEIYRGDGLGLLENMIDRGEVGWFMVGPFSFN